jgi:hypothetical protein
MIPAMSPKARLIVFLDVARQGLLLSLLRLS